MMGGGDSCWQGRSPLDRLRNLSITCLVLDAIFALLYGVSALKDSTSEEKLQCYKDYGYYWHNVVELAFAVSSVAAVCGIAIHASISCAASFQDRQLVNANYFGHGLVCWTFLQALAEAIAYRQEPQDCIDRYGSQSSTSSADSTDESGTNLVWQVAYTMLWLSWVTGAVATAVLSRRMLPILHHLQATSTPGTPGWSPSTDSNEAGTMPQTVGMPVQFPTNGSMQLAGDTSSQGACGPAAGAATQGAALPASPSAGWQGGDSAMVVAGGGLVAQGRPVAGSSYPDPEKAAAQAGASVAKTGSE
mmetsp:Transcript_20780/g.44367  ORF Transcript_20780/g.44367 Transcript_20780/m.44367 type:complete len:304 (+) Transcript_20780:60-971(+)